MSAIPQEVPGADTILFRPSKKRKIYRQRANSVEAQAVPSISVSPPPPAALPPSSALSIDELIASSSTTSPPPNLNAEEGLEGTIIPISEILRLRKRNKRAGGVEFTSSGSAQITRNEDGIVVPSKVEDGERGEQGGLGVRKFAPQTGAVGDVNKHMMAYIDSELAKRRLEQLPTQTQPQLSNRPHTLLSHPSTIPSSSTDTKAATETQRQPATLGKLHEIDLGTEARELNVSLTEAARRRLYGEEPVEPAASAKPKKIRLGPDGKPWRGKKRRGSDDIKRDGLVEAVLRENRLDHYEAPTVSVAPNSTGDLEQDGAADDRIAEAFRKEFLDAVSARQRKKVAPPSAPARTAGGKKEEEVLKGPKLGGSRSARAAMRETMLKAGKK